MHQRIPTERLVDWPNREGLTTTDATQRLADFGPNQVVPSMRVGWKTTMADTLRDPMLWFLLIIAALFAVVGNWMEAMVLVVALVPLFGMDLYLHRRTHASTQSLMSRLAETSVVLRDEQKTTLSSDEIVPGDCVWVTNGGFFPADGLLIEGEDLQVDESSLTGESWPVRKQIMPADFHVPDTTDAVIKPEHWGLAGTRLLTGQTWMYVVYTGQHTLYGDIAHTVSGKRHERTPLQQAVTQMVKYLLVAAVMACVILAALRLYQGYGILDALLSALTLAIAALPEEFPVVLTFFLGAGVYRLAHRQALVRRAVAVENIGRVTCICSDKTGTLTEGVLHLAQTQAQAGFTDDKLIELAALACDASGHDPLDEAILNASQGHTGHRPITTFAFTEDRRKTSMVYPIDDRYLSVSKGAPETILETTDLTASDRADWLEKAQALSHQGYKVIACAQIELEAHQWQGLEPSVGLTFVGLLAFEDPLREGVVDAIGACWASQLHVVMVTGDHPGTASAIATKIIGDASSVNVILGDELEDRLDEIGQRGQPLDVVARATPQQKLKLVETLKARGEVVAVTGDGVNDVPALQAADIGIAMGERGTQSAREVAAIVLLDDNFKTIVGAIGEGRQLFINLQRSFQYLLMIHFPLVLSAALIPMLGYPLLFLPAHLVWMELIIHPTALLVFQQRSKALVSQACTRGTQIQFFDRYGWGLIIAVGLLGTAMVMATYVLALDNSDQVEHARTLALVTLVLISATLTAALSAMQTRASWALVCGAPLLSAALIYWPVTRQALHLSALHWDDWGLAGLAALVIGAVTFIAQYHATHPSHRFAKSQSPRTMGA